MIKVIAGFLLGASLIGGIWLSTININFIVIPVVEGVFILFALAFSMIEHWDD